MPATKKPSVAGVVLAAGSSIRLGRNKLLLDLGGETVVRRAARAAIEAQLEPVIVVLGHEAERVGKELAGLPCVLVVNPEHARGAGTSLRVGVTRAAETEAEGLVLMLADMPLVTASMLALLVARRRETQASLVVSHFGETQAPPSFFHRSLFAELQETDDERCAKRVVRHHAAEAVVVSWPEAALQDLDVAADYDRLRTQLAAP